MMFSGSHELRFVLAKPFTKFRLRKQRNVCLQRLAAAAKP